LAVGVGVDDRFLESIWNQYRIRPIQIEQREVEKPKRFSAHAVFLYLSGGRGKAKEELIHLSMPLDAPWFAPLCWVPAVCGHDEAGN